MLPNWNDMRVAEQRRHELLAEAARDRLAGEAGHSEAPPTRPALHARTLARLGRLMVCWGARLQRLDPVP